MFALAALVAAAGLATAPAPRTDLTIRVWPQGLEEGVTRTWRLRCEPTGGTLPRAAEACRRLAALAQPFAPVPKDVVCTQVFGGPQVARVTGTFERRRVWATFRRSDGCHIARWNRHRFLFPGIASR